LPSFFDFAFFGIYKKFSCFFDKTPYKKLPFPLLAVFFKKPAILVFLFFTFLVLLGLEISLPEIAWFRDTFLPIFCVYLPLYAKLLVEKTPVKFAVFRAEILHVII